jgi:hypothetical protein
VARTGYRLLADGQSLLLIILDDLRRANFRFVRIKSDVAKGTSLAQEVPALIQFHLDLHEPFTISSGMCPLLVQSVFLCDKTLNMTEDRLIFDLILHESLHQRGCARNGQALMLRSPETMVNRCLWLQKKENVPRNHFPARGRVQVHLISLVCPVVWFDEQERQDRPAHQIGCL